MISTKTAGTLLCHDKVLCYGVNNEPSQAQSADTKLLINHREFAMKQVVNG